MKRGEDGSLAVSGRPTEVKGFSCSDAAKDVSPVEEDFEEEMKVVVFRDKYYEIFEADLRDLQHTDSSLSGGVVDFCFCHLSSLCRCQDIYFVPTKTSVSLSHFVKFERCKECADDELELSGKNLVFFPVFDINTKHYSLLVYNKHMNLFVHHDNKKGVNRFRAEMLYKAMKKLMGHSSLSRLSIESENEEDKKSVLTETKSMEDPTSYPCFIEADTPQQMKNGHDGVLFGMAIAKVIIEWYENGSKDKGENWFTEVQKHVDAPKTSKMRTEVLKLIEARMNEEAV